jgi:hypothetical protein
MDLVHKTVNWATLRSTMDLRTERGRSSPECRHAGIPVHRTSPWQCGEQDERMGILTPGGTSWWRGSDGRALAKGGSGRASSMRRCSGHEGEERGAWWRCLGVWRPFIGPGRQWRGAEAVSRWCGFYSPSVFEGFKRRGRGFDEVWLDEGRGRDDAWLGFSRCTGGAWRTTAATGRTVAVALATEGGRRASVDHVPEWPGGPNATWAGAERKQRKTKKWDGLQGWLGWNQRWACRKFLFKFWIKDLSSNKIVWNIFKLNLNGVQTRINSNKLFEDFSNLKLLEIDLNNQI